MKKITLLTVLLAFTMLVNAQMNDIFSNGEKYGTPGKTVILKNTNNTKSTSIMTEDFSSGALPTGWQNIDNGTTGFVWTFNNPGGRTINTTTNANGFAIFDSDNNGGGAEDADLITGAIDCSGNTAVFLSFEHYFYAGYGATAEVSVSGDNGATWTSLEVWSATSTNNAELAEYDITAIAAGNSQVLIKWNWTGDYSWYWAIDDISVYEPDAHDLAVTTSTPNLVFSGNSAIPSLTVKNNGASDEATYSVKMTITGTTAYDNFIDITTPLVSGNDTTIDFPAWTPANGTYTIKAIVYNVTGDAVTTNDTLISTCEVRDIAFGDVVNSFPCVAAATPGIETDGTNIYTTKWNAGDFYRYTMDGTFVDSFTVAGVSDVRDMAYDGTYFYGAAANTSLFQMDFTQGAENLVSTITAPTDCRAIAYDDAAVGFWANNWATDLTLFNMSGTTQNSISNVPSIYGAAYDKWSNAANPSVWLFQGTGGGDSLAVVEYNIQTKLATGRKIIVEGMPGVTVSQSGAGGLASFADTVNAYLLLNVQQDPNFVIQIFLKDLATVNTTNNTLKSNIILYPNPTTGLLNITNAENAIVNIYNMVGEVVATATNVSSMDISNLENGTYIVKVISNNSATTKKITLVK